MFVTIGADDPMWRHDETDADALTIRPANIFVSIGETTPPPSSDQATVLDDNLPAFVPTPHTDTPADEPDTHTADQNLNRFAQYTAVLSGRAELP